VILNNISDLNKTSSVTIFFSVLNGYVESCVTCSAVWVLAASSNEWLSCVIAVKCCLCSQRLVHIWCARCVNSVPAPAHRGPTFKQCFQ